MIGFRGCRTKRWRPCNSLTFGSAVERRSGEDDRPGRVGISAKVPYLFKSGKPHQRRLASLVLVWTQPGETVLTATTGRDCEGHAQIVVAEEPAICHFGRLEVAWAAGSSIGFHGRGHHRCRLDRLLVELAAPGFTRPPGLVADW